MDINVIINTSFKVINSSLVLGMFSIDTEVLEIGNKDVISVLSYLAENGFSVDTHDRCLRNSITG